MLPGCVASYIRDPVFFSSISTGSVSSDIQDSVSFLNVLPNCGDVYSLDFLFFSNIPVYCDVAYFQCTPGPVFGLNKLSGSLISDIPDRVFVLNPSSGFFSSNIRDFWTFSVCFEDKTRSQVTKILSDFENFYMTIQNLLKELLSQNFII
jgi:hypothetical protein